MCENRKYINIFVNIFVNIFLNMFVICVHVIKQNCQKKTTIYADRIYNYICCQRGNC